MATLQECQWENGGKDGGRNLDAHCGVSLYALHGKAGADPEGVEGCNLGVELDNANQSHANSVYWRFYHIQDLLIFRVNYSLKWIMQTYFQLL